MDRQSVYSLSVFGRDPAEEPDSRAHIQQQFVEFVLDFQLDNVFVYRSVEHSDSTCRLRLG